MAGEGRRSRGQGLVRRAESTNARLSRQIARPRGDRETIDGVVRQNFADLFLARFTARPLVRDEVSTAKAAADAGDAGVGRRSEIGEDGARSERARRKRYDHDRLVRAVARWQVCRDLDFARRERGRHPAYL